MQGQFNINALLYCNIQQKGKKQTKSVHHNLYNWSISRNLCLLIIVHACALIHVQLCIPMDCSHPGSSVHGILQARILEWIAIFSFRGSSPPRDWICVSCSSCFARRISSFHLLQLVQLLSCVRLSVIPWTATHQASLHHFLEFAQLMYIESVMPSNHCTLCHLLSCLQSFLASESFPMIWVFTSGGQNIRAPA